MVFTLRQLQEKCREQRKQQFITFVDLTKAFDTVRRKSLYKILEKIGCPPILFAVNHFFSQGHECVHSMEIHQSLSRWGVVLNRVVLWHPLFLPFTLLPSFNMPLMGTRMECTSEPDSISFQSEKTEVWNDWWLKCWLENCSSPMML